MRAESTVTIKVIIGKAETPLAVKTIFEDAREVEVVGEYDVFVLSEGGRLIESLTGCNASGGTVR